MLHRMNERRLIQLTSSIDASCAVSVTVRDLRQQLAAAGLGLCEAPARQASELGRRRQQRIAAGELAPGDVAAVRALLGLTQARFAEVLGISVGTLRNWEQNRTAPNATARTLLRIAARHPSMVREHISARS